MCDARSFLYKSMGTVEITAIQTMKLTKKRCTASKAHTMRQNARCPKLDPAIPHIRQAGSVYSLSAVSRGQKRMQTPSPSTSTVDVCTLGTSRFIVSDNCGKGSIDQVLYAPHAKAYAFPCGKGRWVDQLTSIKQSRFSLFLLRLCGTGFLQP